MIDSKLSYKLAGVDIDVGNQLVSRIKPLAAKTHRKGLLGGIGGFGALFEIPLERYQQPVLVSSTDGVGTKLKLAIEMDKHDTIGIDLVAMCVNDIIVQGAEPLFFLDYFATGKLHLDRGENIIAGIAEGCTQAGAALVGGETAEMPGMYEGDDYDLAGFAVGIVEKDKLISGSDVAQGDVLIALPSSGLHSNGFSLVRKILTLGNHTLTQPFGTTTLGETLLTPTKIYVKPLLNLLSQVSVKALAHITGGGLVENLPRVLPQYTQAIIDTSSWEIPTIFKWLQAQGNIDQEEMFKTFNCGVGFIICVAPEKAETVLKTLQEDGQAPWVIGKIKAQQQQEPVVGFK